MSVLFSIKQSFKTITPPKPSLFRAKHSHSLNHSLNNTFSELHTVSRCGLIWNRRLTIRHHANVEGFWLVFSSLMLMTSSVSRASTELKLTRLSYKPYSLPPSWAALVRHWYLELTFYPLSILVLHFILPHSVPLLACEAYRTLTLAHTTFATPPDFKLSINGISKPCLRTALNHGLDRRYLPNRHKLAFVSVSVL